MIATLKKKKKDKLHDFGIALSYFCLEFLWQMSLRIDTTFQLKFSSDSNILRSFYLHGVPIDQGLPMFHV